MLLEIVDNSNKDNNQTFQVLDILFFHKEMKVVTLCVLAVLLVGRVTGDLPPPERSYRILMLLPAAPKSHRIVFMALSNALVDRGHKVGHCVRHSGVISDINNLSLYCLVNVTFSPTDSDAQRFTSSL